MILRRKTRLPYTQYAYELRMPIWSSSIEAGKKITWQIRRKFDVPKSFLPSNGPKLSHNSCPRNHALRILYVICSPWLALENPSGCLKESRKRAGGWKRKLFEDAARQTYPIESFDPSFMLSDANATLTWRHHIIVAIFSAKFHYTKRKILYNIVPFESIGYSIGLDGPPERTYLQVQHR